MYHIGLAIVIILTNIVCIPICYLPYADINSRMSISSLSEWENLGIVENQSYTDCYGTKYTSLSKFIHKNWVYLPDSTSRYIVDLPIDKQFRVYKKSYWLGLNYYLIVCVE